jgi:hypothetical protein
MAASYPSVEPLGGYMLKLFAVNNTVTNATPLAGFLPADGCQSPQCKAAGQLQAYAKTSIT